jgi:hypothetical protein
VQINVQLGNEPFLMLPGIQHSIIRFLGASYHASRLARPQLYRDHPNIAPHIAAAFKFKDLRDCGSDTST